jgi:hypothetical protein
LFVLSFVRLDIVFFGTNQLTQGVSEIGNTRGAQIVVADVDGFECVVVLKEMSQIKRASRTEIVQR